MVSTVEFPRVGETFGAGTEAVYSPQPAETLLPDGVSQSVLENLAKEVDSAFTEKDELLISASAQRKGITGNDEGLGKGSVNF